MFRHSKSNHQEDQRNTEFRSGVCWSFVGTIAAAAAVFSMGPSSRGYGVDGPSRCGAKQPTTLAQCVLVAILFGGKCIGRVVIIRALVPLRGLFNESEIGV